MNVKKNGLLFGGVVSSILLSYYFLDKQTALFVKNVLMKNHDVLSSNVPDFLFVMVCLLTVVGLTGYYYRSRKGIYNTDTRFFQLLAITTPVAFALKWSLKYFFGRIDARYWVRYPGSREFHWFHGGGNYSAFPSGHMAVFAALLITTARLYPRLRNYCYALLAVLGLALILTNYHYVSDVIAGTYVGLLVSSFAFVSLPLHSNGKTTMSDDREHLS